MVATFDALIFVAVLAIVSVSLINVQPSEPDTPDASEICDSLSAIRLDPDTLVDGSRIGNVSVWDASALSMRMNDTSFISGYLQSVMGDILGGRYGYEMTVSFQNYTMSFGEGKGEPTSECTAAYEVIGGDSVRVCLVIY